jgi:hypothetical protein
MFIIEYSESKCYSKQEVLGIGCTLLISEHAKTKQYFAGVYYCVFLGVADQLDRQLDDSIALVSSSGFVISFLLHFSMLISSHFECRSTAKRKRYR